jgi:hypothetical protein
MKPKNSFLLLTLSLMLICFAVYASLSGKLKKDDLPVRFESCVIVGSGRAPAIIKIWEEKADNTKGRVLIDERWIQRGERITCPNERGRIIYDYKYRSDDTWKSDVHAWCHRGDETKIP